MALVVTSYSNNSEINSCSEICQFSWVGAAGRIAYALIPLVCNGSTFGMDRKIDLRLIDVEFSMVKLQGKYICLDLKDCSITI
jgi:hypothetical protein